MLIDAVRREALLGLLGLKYGSREFVVIDMNYFDAVGVFFAFMDAKPCWQKQSEVWPEVG